MVDGRRRSPGGRLLIALVIVVISLVSYYGKNVFNPVTEEHQHIDLTVDQEIALGLQAAPQMAAQYGGLHPDRRAQQRVKQIGNRIVSRTKAGSTPYKFDFNVLADEKTINAFALPGGQVFITAALLERLQTPGQLAGVLGHEIGHVVARHSAEHLAKAQLTQGLSGAAAIAMYDPDNPNSQRNAAIAMAIGQLVNLRFGRQDELEADRLGVRFTAEAGYDPRAMIGVMDVLEQASQGRAPPEFFSTHPNPGNRRERIQAAIQERFPKGLPDGLEE